MEEKKKVKIVNAITGTRFAGTLLLPLITSLLGPLGTAIYIGTLWTTDAVDGFLARKWKVSTIFGANFDAFCDKTLGVAILIYLCSFYPYMILPIISEAAIFGTNWHYGKKGADVKTSIFGKIKTGILDASTVLAILSTLPLTSSLTAIIPYLIVTTSAAQLVTFTDYVEKNKRYLKTHKPKNDVSHMGFFETIKAIIKKLGDKNLYSPAYFKEHQNEPLLDMLYNEEEPQNIEIPVIETNEEVDSEEPNGLSIQQKNELKINYNLLDSEVKGLEYELFIKKNMKYEDIVEFLNNHPYIYSINDMKTEKLSKTKDKTLNKSN